MIKFNTEEETLSYEKFELLIQGLIDNDYGVYDNFLNESLYQELKKNLISLRSSDLMKPAGVGTGDNFHINTEVRSDFISWIGSDSHNIHEKEFNKIITSFILYLNETCFTGIKSFEAMYANYPIGAYYKKHVDTFKNTSERKYSLIIYLNDHWEEKNRGEIKLYFKNETICLAPKGNRALLFESHKIPHEVIPSVERDRMSIAVWLKT